MKTLIQNCLIDGALQFVLINNECLESVTPFPQEANRIIDLEGKMLIPGMIDLHTHIRDLQQTHKEDWHSASSAALAGGVTTVFDMPNTVPATDTLEHLIEKQHVATCSKVNYGMYGGATPHNLEDLEEMLDEGSISGLKVFLSASSSNEVVADENLLKQICALARKYDKPVLTHCELQDCITEHEKMYQGEAYNSVMYHGAIRNRVCAYKAVELMLKISSEVKNKLMILHVSTEEEMALVKTFKQAADFPIYAEVTPHHLFLTEDVLKNAGNYGKVNPPLRMMKDTDALMNALLTGYIDTIGSDHAPHGLQEKQKPYREAPSGFPGLETSLPLLLSRHLQQKDIPLDTIIRLTSTNPSHIMQLEKRGKLLPGYYADFAVIDQHAELVVSAEHFLTKAKYTPFEGFPLRGKVVTTFINGKEHNQKGKAIFHD